MALWQIIETRKGELADQWDDGLMFEPGEEGFTSDLVEHYAGAGNFNYIGTPNWSQRIEAESQEAAAAEERAAETREAEARKAEEARQQAEAAELQAAREAAARDRIAQLMDPAGYARAQADAAIVAEHEELAEFASDEEVAQLDAVKQARLAALDPAPDA